MFDFQLGASELLPEPFAPTFFAETVARVCVWLESQPDTQSLLNHLPALELALAAHVKNHDTELLTLTTRALERINADANFEVVTNEMLAAIILLNLRVFQVNHDAKFQDAAQGTTRVATRRFDDKLDFFKTDTSQVFYTDANARLGEAFYFAWRVLDDQTLRPMAGAILGQVGDLFDGNAGLYQHAELPDGARSETQSLGAYTAALQMFLTASETTARRTYMPRASILADFALANLNIETALWIERAKFADALLRLEQFTNDLRYRDTAREILKNALGEGEPNITAAPLALAVEHAEHFPLHIVLIGDVETDENAKALWFAALNEYASSRAIEILHPIQHTVRIQQLGYFASDQNALAYICSGLVCLPPVSSVEAFKSAMQTAF